MDISAGLPTFAITLREGVEAALVVGIVLALLQKAKQTAFNPWVYGGVGAGLMASILAGTGLNNVLRILQTAQDPYAIVFLPFLKAVFSLMAIALLTWMLIWMTQQARHAKTQLEGALTQVLQAESNTQWGIFTLVFIAVFREGLETALFIVAQPHPGWMAVLGSGLGLLVATGIGWALFALGIRINLQRFFQVLGIFLLLIVGGLVVGFCKQLDMALVSLSAILPTSLCLSPSEPQSLNACVMGPLVWDARYFLPEGQFPGLVLKTFLGYRDRLFLGQAIAYLIFMATAGTLYWQSIVGNSQRPAPNSSPPSPANLKESP